MFAEEGHSSNFKATFPCLALLEPGQALGDGVGFLLLVQKALL